MSKIYVITLGNTLLLLAFLSLSTGNLFAQSFKAPKINPFSLTTSGKEINPTLVDIDGDNDLDLFVDKYDSIGEIYIVHFYENVGRSHSPGFLPSVPFPFGANFHQNNDFSSFVDLDGDGDLDIMTSDPDWKDFIYYENTGTPTNPVFALGYTNQFGLTPDAEAKLSFADMDADGDQDLFAGDYYTGQLRYYENTGTANAPQFAPAKLFPFALYSVGFISGIELYDFDQDGDFDLTVGGKGELYYFQNIGSANIPNFAPADTNHNDIALITDAYTYSTYGDLDDDGDIDLLVQGERGDFEYLEQVDPLSIKEESKFGQVSAYPNPATDLVQISIPDNEELVFAEIRDLQGKLLKEFRFTHSTELISIKELSSGIYLLNLRLSYSAKSVKIIVE